MAQIQWYPGHMHKAAKEIREALSQVDMFLELLDARIPFSSENPMLESLRGDKPCYKVMTKTDLADPLITKQWQSWFEANRSVKTLALNTAQRQQVKSIPAACRALFAGRDVVLKPITVMVIGIPNVGKSTIINVLADRAIAKTGNEAAMTRHQQRIPLDNGIVLMDTPGILWPNLENPGSGFRLAATGAIRDSALTHLDVAWFIIEFLLANYPKNLLSRYQYKADSTDPMLVFEHIGRSRGCLKSGGKVDMDRVAKIVLNELLDGTIGALTLETPEVMQREIAELEVLRAERAAKKAARKSNWKKSVSKP